MTSNCFPVSIALRVCLTQSIFCECSTSDHNELLAVQILMLAMGLLQLVGATHP